MEEVRDKLGTPITSDMSWDSVLREDIDDEQSSELRCHNIVRCRDENALFRELIYDYEES